MYDINSEKAVRKRRFYYHVTFGESAPSRHPIPVQVGTLIRNKPAGDSGANQQVFVIERNDLLS